MRGSEGGRVSEQEREREGERERERGGGERVHALGRFKASRVFDSAFAASFPMDKKVCVPLITI